MQRTAAKSSVGYMLDELEWPSLGAVTKNSIKIAMKM